MNKHLLHFWDIRHPVESIGHRLCYVWKWNILGPLLIVILLLHFIFLPLLLLSLLLFVFEVFLLPFCFLAALLILILILIALLLKILEGVQGTALLLTAEISLKSRPSSARLFCTGVMLISMDVMSIITEN